jgi:hypothetical protein
MDCEHQAYIKDLFSTIRDIAAMTRSKRLSSPGGDRDASEAYEGALLSILILMQARADLLGLDRRSVGMDDFDPLADRLER